MTSELKTTQDLVMEILQASEKARNSDNYLLYAVYTKVAERRGIDLSRLSAPTFLLHIKDYGFPSPETIRRTRQKIQAAYPELAGSDEVEGYRVLKEESFRDYARGHVV